jgi:hypothetical protein
MNVHVMIILPKPHPIITIPLIPHQLHIIVHLLYSNNYNYGGNSGVSGSGGGYGSYWSGGYWSGGSSEEELAQLEKKAMKKVRKLANKYIKKKALSYVESSAMSSLASSVSDDDSDSNSYNQQY